MYPLSTATPADATALAALINSAYRGDSSRQGWTTEADLLAGRRTDSLEIGSLMADPAKRWLCCRDGRTLVGCVLLQAEQQPGTVSLSMLAVQPNRQGNGIGRCLLAAAERIAVEDWGARRISMWVIPCRSELLAYYQRRGYRRSGECQPFPSKPELWTTKVVGLTLERLDKILNPA